MIAPNGFAEWLRFAAATGMLASIATALLFAGFNPTRVNRWCRSYMHLAWALALARVFVSSFGSIIDIWSVIVWLNVAASSVAFIVATFITIERDHWQRKRGG